MIGRKKEQEELDKIYHSNRPEFVAIYGRRRVGKTFLVNQALKGRITFHHTGVSPVDQSGEKNRMRIQLESFYFSLLNHGLEGFSKPKSWMEAFFMLEVVFRHPVSKITFMATFSPQVFFSSWMSSHIVS